MVITQADRQLVAALYEGHRDAIDALYKILSEQHEEFVPLNPVPGQSTTSEMKVVVNGVTIVGTSVPKLFVEAMKFLSDGRHLDHLPLPIESGNKRFLIANTPTHLNGNAFTRIAQYQGYYMEANKSRNTAMKDLMALFEKCGLKAEPLISSESAAFESLDIG